MQTRKFNLEDLVLCPFGLGVIVDFDIDESKECYFVATGNIYTSKWYNVTELEKWQEG